MLDASQDIDILQQQVNMQDGGVSYIATSFDINLLHTHSTLKARMHLCCRYRLYSSMR